MRNRKTFGKKHQGDTNKQIIARLVFETKSTDALTIHKPVLKKDETLKTPHGLSLNGCWPQVLPSFRPCQSSLPQILYTQSCSMPIPHASTVPLLSLALFGGFSPQDLIPKTSHHVRHVHHDALLFSGNVLAGWGLAEPTLKHG